MIKMKNISQKLKKYILMKTNFKDANTTNSG